MHRTATAVISGRQLPIESLPILLRFFEKTSHYPELVRHIIPKAHCTEPAVLIGIHAPVYPFLPTLSA